LKSSFSCASFVLFVSAPTRTWLVGDSIIFHVGKTNTQLQGGGLVIWKGLSGAKISGLRNRLSRMLHKYEYPTTIILHLGTNDIFNANLGVIRARIKSNLQDVRNLLPNTRVIWSDILPRRKYKLERKEGAGKKCTIDLNKYAHQICDEIRNACVIRSSHIFNPLVKELFHDDVHLSDVGAAHFKLHLSNALSSFNRYPEVTNFPPIPPKV
jgi:lysophospholipase L1-like esterase